MSSLIASIVYLANGRDTGFKFFADSLAHQLDDGSDIEVIMIDNSWSEDREVYFKDCVANRFRFIHAAPKPSPFSGPYKRTSNEYLSLASARNTGILQSEAPYIFFVRDGAVAAKGWWRAAREAALNGYVVTGAVQQCTSLQMNNGRPGDQSFGSKQSDTRLNQVGSSSKPIEVSGHLYYGPLVGAPRSVLEDINGFDELCDSTGGEDWHLGQRLSFSGESIFFDGRMLMYEQIVAKRKMVGPLFFDPELHPHEYKTRLASFGITERQCDGPYSCSRMLVDILYGLGSAATMGNYYWLADLKTDQLLKTVERFPARHWFSAEPLESL
jgi:hypothetical protein